MAYHASAPPPYAPGGGGAAGLQYVGGHGVTAAAAAAHASKYGHAAAAVAPPTSKIQLSFSCAKLRNADVLSKSDPQVWLWALDAKTRAPHLLGKTEAVKDKLSPSFTKTVLVDYHFEEVQRLRVSVVDVDKPKGGFGDQDLLGEVELTLASIVTASESQRMQLTRPLHHPSKADQGSVTIVAEEIGDLNKRVTLQLSGRKLAKKDTFGKSDPFVVISRVRENNQYVSVHQTEVIKRTLNPDWAPIELPAAVLCAGDFDRTLRFDVYDWDKRSAPDAIGHFVASLNDLARTKEFRLTDPKAATRKKPKDVGTVVVGTFAVTSDKSFLDYVRDGAELNVMLAIDFTQSNGDPASPSSLHYMNPMQMNSYQQAIRATCDVLLEYDTDKNVPTYGFGAKVNGKTTHCFPLNGNPSNPEVHGIAGVEAAYAHTLQHCRLYGPTNFRQTLQTAGRIADAFQRQYLVVVILTDGVISDLDQTIDEIISLCSRPVSIVIVGVGNADFEAMERLDGDDGVLRSESGARATRDIVQFVALNTVGNDPPALARELLAEIPAQFCAYQRLQQQRR